jgi:lipoate-protein ligase A
MYFVDNNNEHDPAINLALEEYVLRHSQPGEDLVLFYINEPSIIIGRHQNTIEEINADYVQQHNLHVVRRLSGGGAVYHDLGNLNFSFITDYQADNFSNFRKFTEPVVRTLIKLGVNAEMSGRNDILVDERKVSGNAQYISASRMVSHGTLLFNSDLSHVADALHVHENKFASKAVKSVRSRVANISEFLPRPIEIEDFKKLLLDTYFEGSTEIRNLPLTNLDWNNVHALADTRYRTWEWNYGKSPEFNIEKRQRFSGGEIIARLNVKGGVIQSIKFYGDYFSESTPEELESLFTNLRFTREELIRASKSIDINRFFNGMDQKTLIDFLLA